MKFDLISIAYRSDVILPLQDFESEGYTVGVLWWSTICPLRPLYHFFPCHERCHDKYLWVQVMVRDSFPSFTGNALSAV